MSCLFLLYIAETKEQRIAALVEMLDEQDPTSWLSTST